MNPHIEGQRAEVKVCLEINGRDLGTQLTLAADPWPFQADCSGGSKERLVWRVVQTQEVIP
ncbi:MAG: hypothetical protein HC915_08550 [Anaerolineae bacterium]|nr:hypothetical protein [Anaerolineae bacterium]